MGFVCLFYFFIVLLFANWSCKSSRDLLFLAESLVFTWLVVTCLLWGLYRNRFRPSSASRCQTKSSCGSNAAPARCSAITLSTSDLCALPAHSGPLLVSSGPLRPEWARLLCLMLINETGLNGTAVPFPFSHASAARLVSTSMLWFHLLPHLFVWTS